jgi:hypothetical protein
MATRKCAVSSADHSCSAEGCVTDISIMTAFLPCTDIIYCVCMAAARDGPPFRGEAKNGQQSRTVPRCRDLPIAVYYELDLHCCFVETMSLWTCTKYKYWCEWPL